ncbi:MAG: PQQ-dependent sugar dehydrogenase [Nitrospira sp.]|nr:PQQ-dependent sugar dehydrogenase [Nitrospira sp.]
MKQFILLTTLVIIILMVPFSTAFPASLCTEPSSTAPIPHIGLEEIAGGFLNPTHITHAGDGSGRLFVVEQGGTIRIIENGKVLPVPFLDIRDRVESGGEKGLLSVAFHPRYKENGLFYVDYTTSLSGGLYTHISRFRRKDHNHAAPESEVVLLRIKQPYSNHNGGQVAFGPDGYLYIGMGDGGSADDPYGNGQNTAVLLGKLLRIDVDHEETPRHYAIPKDNPFAGKKAGREEIWAYGLRNPWRFSFDAANGRLYLADVGQDTEEEINVIEKGSNYGWNIMEGDICTPGVNKDCNKNGLKMPILTYRHPEGFSITGGFVYRGNSIPGLCGVYLYADYVTRKIWGLRYDGNKVTARTELVNTNSPNLPGLLSRLVSKLQGPSLSISSFGEDQNHELYIAGHKDGKIIKIIAAK